MRENTQPPAGEQTLEDKLALELSGRGQQLELFEPEEIIRPDYNIGKYATFLFASPHLKTLDEERRIEWGIAAPDGSGEAVAAIAITPLRGQIIPTTTTFKVFMGILQLWNMQGQRPSGEVYFSDRQLSEVSGWYWTGRIAQRIRDHLNILQGTSIDWELSFKTEGRVESLVQKMHLIEEATHLDRRLTFGKQKFTVNHIARINATLVQNMLANNVRPINFEAIRQIRSDASTRLYMMLDLYLASKTKWERRSLALLIDDLSYEGKRYENRGERKRTLARLVKDLDGKELGHGKLAVTIEETSDGKDWKLVARRVKRIERGRKPLPVVRDEEGAEWLADELLLLFPSPKGAPKRGFMVFLCKHYPEPVLRDALSRAKSDYAGNVRKSVGAIFRYELEMIVKGRGDLTWYREHREKK